MSENLSESLFKPQKHSKETSSIIGHTTPENHQGQWYRVLRKSQWTFQGIPPLMMEETFARIAASKHARIHEALLDTIEGYRLGNWSYEWTQTGIQLQKKAQALEEQNHAKEAQNHKKENLLALAKAWFTTANAFALASYPHLKNDVLASHAQVLANKAFANAIEHAPFKIKTVKVKIAGKEVTGYLYLPNTDTILPTVIVSAGLDCLQIELWRLFLDYFYPANIAMLTIDMPGIGQSASIDLSENMSTVQHAMLNELVNVPWVDHHRVGTFGMRFGGTASVRLAFIEPNMVKACVALGGFYHQFLTAPNTIDSLPTMLKDVIASRLNIKAITLNTLVQLQAFSLKQQGFLTGRRTRVPILLLREKNDRFNSEGENELVAVYSHGGKAKSLSTKKIHDTYHTMMEEAVSWFQASL